MGAGEGGFEQAGSVAGFGAEFGGVVAGVDLEEDGEGAGKFTGGGVEAGEQFLGIDTLDTIKVGGGEAGLVGLEVADEFPAQGQGRDLGAFLGAFLDAVFTDAAQAEAGCELGGPGGVGFGNGEKLDGRGIAAAGGAGGRDGGLHSISTV